MQEKKNKRLAGILAVLIAGCVGLGWYGGRTSDEFDDRDLFRLDDYRRVSKLTFARGGQTLELAYRGARWEINNAYAADRNLVTVLFATLQRAEARRPVNRDSISRWLDKHGTRVTLFEGDRPVQEFLAGGNSEKTRSYFKYPGNDQVYQMIIPGYRAYVSGILELGALQWRDKYVFDINWTNFVRLEAQFPSDAGAGFNIVKSREGFFAVEGVQSDTAVVHDFLDAVSLLTAVEYRDENVDSLRAKEPEMKITIGDVAGHEYTLWLFDNRSERVPGLLNGRDVAMFNRRDLEPVLRKKETFATR